MGTQPGTLWFILYFGRDTEGNSVRLFRDQRHSGIFLERRTLSAHAKLFGRHPEAYL